MWTLNNIRIFVQGYSSNNKALIARLNPVGAGTVLHFFGYDELIVKIKGTVVGNTDTTSIKSLANTGLSYELMTPEGSAGNYFVVNVDLERLPVICQSMRTDLPENSPVYTVNIELYHDI